MELEQWKAEFKIEIGKQAAISGAELDRTAEAELENWLEDDEWMHSTPRDAVASNLSYWCD